MFGALETQTLDTARNVFDTNFFGVLRLTKAVMPSMKSNREGHIICITSMGGINGVPFNSVYCATKFAVEGLVESLAPMLKTFNVRLVYTCHRGYTVDFRSDSQWFEAWFPVP